MNPLQIISIVVGFIGAALLADKKVAKSVPSSHNDPDSEKPKGSEPDEQAITDGDSGGSNSGGSDGNGNPTGLGLDS